MSIRPVDYNGMIQRTNDVSSIKQSQDNKPLVEQQTIQTAQLKHEKELTQKVMQAKEKENEAYRYDAKEKGNGKYEGKGNRHKQKNDEGQRDDRVILKDHPSGFDIKI